MGLVLQQHFIIYDSTFIFDVSFHNYGLAIDN